jgi:hypothetical protein
MVVARIASLFPLIAASLFMGQTMQPVLKVQVLDPSMAPVPNAMIVIRGESGDARDLRTDNVGEATIGVVPGQYLVSVSAIGFESWKSDVEMRSNANRSVRVNLKIAGMCSPCVTIVEPAKIDFEHIALDAAIPLIPLRSVPVPAQRLRLPRRPHLGAARAFPV